MKQKQTWFSVVALGMALSVIGATGCGTNPKGYNSVPRVQKARIQGSIMAHKFISGFESGGTHDWTSAGGSSVQSGTVRTGGFALQVSAAGQSPRKSSLGSVDEVYGRFYFKTSANQGVTIGLLQDNVGNQVIPISLNTNGEISSTGISGTPNKIVLNEWNRVQWHCVVSTGVVEIQLNDGPIQSTSGETFLGANINQLFIGSCNAFDTVTANLYFDDVTLNDTSGSVNNSWPGEGEIYLIQPSADASPNNWTPSTGTLHYAVLDDFTTAETLRTTSNTLNLEDRWDMADLPASVSPESVVKGIMFGVSGIGSGTTSRTAMLRVRDASGNTQDGTNFNWGVSFQTLVYPMLTAGQTWEGSPAPLTVAYVNAMQAAAIDTNSNNRQIDWHYVWANVELVQPGAVMQPAPGLMFPVFPE